VAITKMMEMMEIMKIIKIMTNRNKPRNS
jgi:hypothetical protein